MEEEEEEPGEKDCVDSVESFWQKAMASILYKIGNIENIMETNNLFEDETVLSEQRNSSKKSLDESHLEGKEEEEENDGKEIATNMEQAGVEGSDLVQAEMNEEVRRRQSDQQKTQSILQGDSQAPSIKEFSAGLKQTVREEDLADTEGRKGEYFEEPEPSKPKVDFHVLKANFYQDLLDLKRNEDYEKKTMEREMQDVIDKQVLERKELGRKQKRELKEFNGENEEALQRFRNIQQKEMEQKENDFEKERRATTERNYPRGREICKIILKRTKIEESLLEILLQEKAFRNNTNENKC